MFNDRATINAQRKADVLEVVTNNLDQFRDLFPLWLEYNWPVWCKFEEMAIEIARKRPHYAVATIWEVIRHHSLMREKAPDFKLNNNFRADVARLFALMHPQHETLFETRKRKALAHTAEEQL